MVLDLEKAYKLKIKVRKQLDRLSDIMIKKIEMYQYMELPEWIEIDGHSINISSDDLKIYDRVLSRREKERPTWGYVLPRYEIKNIVLWDGSLEIDDLPWLLKILKYISGSFVVQKCADDPYYSNAIMELFDDVSDINKSVMEMRKQLL